MDPKQASEKVMKQAQILYADAMKLAQANRTAVTMVVPSVLGVGLATYIGLRRRKEEPEPVILNLPSKDPSSQERPKPPVPQLVSKPCDQPLELKPCGGKLEEAGTSEKASVSERDRVNSLPI